MRALRVEAAGFIHLQPFDQGHAKVLEPPRFFGGQVPHAVLVNQSVWLGVPGLALIAKATFMVAFDGALQQSEDWAL